MNYLRTERFLKGIKFRQKAGVNEKINMFVKIGVKNVKQFKANTTLNYFCLDFETKVKHHTHKYYSLKLLLTLVLALVFNNQSSASFKQKYSDVNTTSAHLLNAANSSTFLLIGDVNFDEFEAEQEDFEDDFLTAFLRRNSFSDKGFFHKNASLTSILFSSNKKRYYIWYCQLKIHC